MYNVERRELPLLFSFEICNTSEIARHKACFQTANLPSIPQPTSILISKLAPQRHWDALRSYRDQGSDLHTEERHARVPRPEPASSFARRGRNIQIAFVNNMGSYMIFQITQRWKDIISSLLAQNYIPQIIENTPDDVKSMLVSPHPPTSAQLKSVSWPTTTDDRVFSWYTEANWEHNATEKTLHVYVGSASHYHGSLTMKKNYMRSQRASSKRKAIEAQMI
jgi:hypothetical protein